MVKFADVLNGWSLYRYICIWMLAWPHFWGSRNTMKIISCGVFILFIWFQFVLLKPSFFFKNFLFGTLFYLLLLPQAVQNPKDIAFYWPSIILYLCNFPIHLIIESFFFQKYALILIAHTKRIQIYFITIEGRFISSSWLIISSTGSILEWRL